jgi:hypothetical protein
MIARTVFHFHFHFHSSRFNMRLIWIKTKDVKRLSVQYKILVCDRILLNVTKLQYYTFILTALPPSMSRLSRENVGASTSHNPMGLHGLLQG